MTIELDRTIRPFEVEPVRVDVTVRARWADLSAASDGRIIFDSGDLWKLYRRNDSLVFHLTSPAFGPIPYTLARLDNEFRTVEVCLHGAYFDLASPVFPLQYPLDELLILCLLSRCGDIAVHACGVVDAEGNGRLFAGPSGAGKTTMARLWQKHAAGVVLNDERIIIRRVDGRFWIYGTPWHGEAEFAEPARAPLTRIFFLHHDSSKIIRPVSTADAAVLLFSCTLPAYHDRKGLELTLQSLDEIVCTVPVAELGVVPDEEMVGFLLAG